MIGGASLDRIPKLLLPSVDEKTRPNPKIQRCQYAISEISQERSAGLSKYAGFLVSHAPVLLTFRHGSLHRNVKEHTYTLQL